MYNIFIIKKIGHHACLRGKDHHTSWGFPLIENILPCLIKKGHMFLHFCYAVFSFFATNFHLFFPTMPFQNSHFSCVWAFWQGKPPLYFFANYVLLCAVQDVQCNTEESPWEDKPHLHPEMEGIYINHFTRSIS